MPDVAVVPFAEEFLGDRLFGAGSALDRDGVLKPWVVLRDRLACEGFHLSTADLLDGSPTAWLHLDAHSDLPLAADPARSVVMIFEPEVTAPRWYRRLRSGAVDAALVYVLSSVHADGKRVRQFRYPQVIDGAPPIERQRDLNLVMINARKYPIVRDGELYTKRERIAAHLALTGDIDVYGRGWGEIDARHPISSIRNVFLRRAAHGPIRDKSAVLRRARFALCFENSVHPGYHTEKLFDALAAGAIPIYAGDPTISRSVPADAFVDFSSLGSARSLREFVRSVSPDREQRIRQVGARFLASEAFRPYTIDAFTRTVVEAIRFVTSRTSGG